jgi:hypothetical protein
VSGLGSIKRASSGSASRIVRLSERYDPGGGSMPASDAVCPMRHCHSGAPAGPGPCGGDRGVTRLRFFGMVNAERGFTSAPGDGQQFFGSGPGTVGA